MEIGRCQNGIERFLCFELWKSWKFWIYGLRNFWTSDFLNLRFQRLRLVDLENFRHSDVFSQHFLDFVEILDPFFLNFIKLHVIMTSANENKIIFFLPKLNKKSTCLRALIEVSFLARKCIVHTYVLVWRTFLTIHLPKYFKNRPTRVLIPLLAFDYLDIRAKSRYLIVA